MKQIKFWACFVLSVTNFCQAQLRLASSVLVEQRLVLLSQQQQQQPPYYASITTKCWIQFYDCNGFYRHERQKGWGDNCPETFSRKTLAQLSPSIWFDIKDKIGSVLFYSTLSIRKHKWFIIRTWTILSQKQSHPRASTRKYQTWDQRKSWWQIFLRGPLWTLSSATCPTLCLRDDPWCARSEDTRQYLRYLNRDKYDVIKHCVTRNFTIS